MNHTSRGLIVNIFPFSEFFGNEGYIERNKTLNGLYMSNKVGYCTNVDSIVGNPFKTSCLNHMARLVLVLLMYISQLKLNFQVCPLPRNGMYVMEDPEESIGSKMKLVKLRRNWKIGFGLS